MSSSIQTEVARLRGSKKLVQVARRGLPSNAPPGLAEVWVSREFLVQVFRHPRDAGHERLTICRTQQNGAGRWEDGISWDELQQLKRECGRGDRWAVEVYPADTSIVDDANMRHLWLLPEAPPFAWGPENRR